MSQERSSFPERMPFWGKEMVSKFCQAAVPENYSRGSTILHPLMSNQFLFLVESGVVNYRYFSKDGAAMTIMQVRPGELFGRKALFDEQRERRLFFVMAETDVRLWKMSKKSFLELLKADSGFAEGMIRHLIYYIDAVEQKLMYSAVLDNYQHMVSLLLDYAEDFKDNTAVVKMTQQNLADLLTLSRQSVSGYLSTMTKQGLICVKRGRIDILDWEAMNRELL